MSKLEPYPLGKFGVNSENVQIRTVPAHNGKHLVHTGDLTFPDSDLSKIENQEYDFAKIKTRESRIRRTFLNLIVENFNKCVYILYCETDAENRRNARLPENAIPTLKSRPKSQNSRQTRKP